MTTDTTLTVTTSPAKMPLLEMSSSGVDLWSLSGAEEAHWTEDDALILDPKRMIAGLGYFVPFGDDQLMVVKDRGGDMTFYAVLPAHVKLA